MDFGAVWNGSYYSMAVWQDIQKKVNRDSRVM